MNPQSAIPKLSMMSPGLANGCAGLPSRSQAELESEPLDVRAAPSPSAVQSFEARLSHEPPTEDGNPLPSATPPMSGAPEHPPCLFGQGEYMRGWSPIHDGRNEYSDRSISGITLLLWVGFMALVCLLLWAMA